MPSHLRNGRSKFPPGERFVQLHYWFLECPAWRSLKPDRKAVYLELAYRFNGRNNGEIALSIRDAARLCNIAKDTAMKALRELEAKGFIAIEKPGGFDYKRQHATEYRLTAQKFGDQQATKDFMRWKPENLKPGPKSGQKRPSSRTVALKKLACAP